MLATVGILGSFALVVAGIVLMDYGKRWGIVLILAGVFLSLAQIIAGILLWNKRHRRKQ